MQTTELSQVNKFQEPWLVENAVFQQQLKLAFKYKNCIHEQPLLNGTHTMPRAAVKVRAISCVVDKCSETLCAVVVVWLLIFTALASLNIWRLLQCTCDW